MIRTFLSAALLATAVQSVPAAAEVVDRSAIGFVTRDSRVVGVGTQEAWLALISPGEWWNDKHTWSGDAANMSLAPQADGCFCERIPESTEDGQIGLEGSVRHMTVVQSYPRRVLRMRGGLGPLQGEPADGVLTITLKPVDGGTRILFEYVVGGYMRLDTAVIAKAVDGVMSQQLAGLAAKLGGAIADDENTGDSGDRNESRADTDAVEADPEDAPERSTGVDEVAAALDAMAKDED